MAPDAPVAPGVTVSVRVRTVLAYVGWGLALVLVISVLAGQLLGQPVLLTYVETGSMAPTIESGDAFVAIPAAVAGPVEPGDVVVFRATVLEGGGLTTHRVMAERDGGYVTRGDANVATDQDAGEPPVQDGQIVAKAWQVGGHVVVIPKLGLVAIVARGLVEGLRAWLAGALGRPGLFGAQGFALGLFVLGVVAYLVATLVEEGDGGGRRYPRTRRRKDTLDARLFVVALALGVALFATASMAFPVGAQEFEMISAENDAPGPRVVQAGTSENLTYIVPGGGVMPVLVMLEPASEGLEVAPRELYVRGGQTRNATVTVTAPEEIGFAPQYLHEHRYLVVLPRGVIRWLYGLHPWAPIVAVDALLSGSFALLGFAMLGGGQLRVRSRTARTARTARREPLDRLRRWLR